LPSVSNRKPARSWLNAAGLVRISLSAEGSAIAGAVQSSRTSIRSCSLDVRGIPGRRALVLGGGGAYGIVQAAYIHAAAEAGFRPDLVIGTSVGALNGAWLAMHPEDTEGLIQIWRDLGDIRVFDANPVRLAARLVRGPRALCRNETVARLLETHLGGVSFADTRLELAVVATNLSRGRKQLFQHGPIAPAILASTAIPGVYEPYEIDGELFVDGCVTASVDLASAVELGATEVLAIELAPPVMHRPAKTALGVLVQSLAVLCHASTDAAEAVASRQAAVRVLRPDLSGLSPWRLESKQGLIDEYLEIARTELATALDPLGHVIASTTPRPRAVAALPAARPKLLVRARSWRKNVA